MRKISRAELFLYVISYNILLQSFILSIYFINCHKNTHNDNAQLLNNGKIINKIQFSFKKLNYFLSFFSCHKWHWNNFLKGISNTLFFTRLWKMLSEKWSQPPKYLQVCAFCIRQNFPPQAWPLSIMMTSGTHKGT